MIWLLRTVFLTAVVLGLMSCNASDEIDSLRTIKDERTVWVFAQFNVMNEDNDLESYYYYGRTSEPLYKRIKNNKIARGFFLLEDVAYYSNKDDKIHAYEDDEEKGELVFRIEDIKRIQLLARPPHVEKRGPKTPATTPAPSAEAVPSVEPELSVESESKQKAPPTPKKAD